MLTVEEIQKLKSQKIFEGHEPEDKMQYLVGVRDHAMQSAYHWDTKSNELRRLQHQASCYLNVSVVCVKCCLLDLPRQQWSLLNRFRTE